MEKWEDRWEYLQLSEFCRLVTTGSVLLSLTFILDDVAQISLLCSCVCVEWLLLHLGLGCIFQ